MKKPKSKEKQKADLKRGRKRSLRFKVSREKVAKKRTLSNEKRIEENKKFEEFMKKMNEARLNGEF